MTQEIVEKFNTLIEDMVFRVQVELLDEKGQVITSQPFELFEKKKSFPGTEKASVLFTYDDLSSSKRTDAGTFAPVVIIPQTMYAFEKPFGYIRWLFALDRSAQNSITVKILLSEEELRSITSVKCVIENTPSR